jgi:hypothetical protein
MPHQLVTNFPSHGVEIFFLNKHTVKLCKQMLCVCIYITFVKVCTYFLQGSEFEFGSFNNPNRHSLVEHLQTAVRNCHIHCSL